MASIHSDAAYRVAQRRGAAAAHDYATWTALVAMSKRELAEIAIRLGSLCADAGNADAALFDGTALARVVEERDTLRAQGII